MTVPVSALQEVAPGAIIELFELQLNTAQHGTNDLYRFHAGTSLNSNGSVYWDGNEYIPFPIEADGFEYSGNGQLPRPKIRVSNILSTITALLLTLPDGLEGAKFTRIRTLARYLDAANFPGGVSPYSPDPTAEFPREIYYVDRKTIENRDVVEFELAAAFDLAGVSAPKRQCIANICQWVYKSTECGYEPKAVMTGTYSSKALSGNYSQSGTTMTVTSTAHGIAAGDQIYLSTKAAISGTYVGGFLTKILTVNATAHGFIPGQTVTLTFTSGSAPPNGNYTVVTAAANSFTVTTAAINSGSGNVNVVATNPTSRFYTVATASSNTFTVTSNNSLTQSGTYTLAWLKVTSNNHGLSIGERIYIVFTSGLADSGAYVVGSTTTNTFTVSTTAEVTTSGTIGITQGYDANDNPVLTAGADVCGKRLSSCRTRFGPTAELPFGSYPGIGTFYG